MVSTHLPLNPQTCNSLTPSPLQFLLEDDRSHSCHWADWLKGVSVHVRDRERERAREAEREREAERKQEGKTGEVYTRQRNHQSCYEYAWGSPHHAGSVNVMATFACLSAGMGLRACGGGSSSSFACVCVFVSDCSDCVCVCLIVATVCVCVSDCSDCVCLCVCVYVRLILLGLWFRPCVCMFICVCELYPTTTTWLPW